MSNWGVSGGRVDLLEAAAGEPALASYDVAIVIEGVNDVGVTPIDEWQRRYKSAIMSIEGRGLTVIVATPPPSFQGGVFTGLFDSTAEAIRSMATTDRLVLDIERTWRDLGPDAAAPFYVDFVHQSTQGQAAMAELAVAGIREAIGRP